MLPHQSEIATPVVLDLRCGLHALDEVLHSKSLRYLVPEPSTSPTDVEVGPLVNVESELGESPFLKKWHVLPELAESIFVAAAVYVPVLRITFHAWFQGYAKWRREN